MEDKAKQPVSPKLLLWIAIISGLAIPTLANIILMATGRPASYSLAIATTTAVLSAGSIPLFIRGLADFKQQTRRAFTLIYLGVVFYGIGQLQFPLFEIISLPAWTNSGAVTLPYFLAIGFIFFGVRRFAKLVGVKSLWMSRILVLLAAIVCGVAVAFLVQGERAPVMAFEVLLSVVLLAAVMLTAQIRSLVAIRYHRFLGFLTASLSMLIFTAIHDIALTLWVPEDTWYSQYADSLPALIAACLFVAASYAFTRINVVSYATGSNESSPIDVITYVASLATNTKDIDEQLDTLRQITSKVSSGAKLTDAQETSLAALYKVIETYLVEKEPLQHFTRPGLRETIRVHFQFDEEKASPFWKTFKES